MWTVAYVMELSCLLMLITLIMQMWPFVCLVANAYLSGIGQNDPAAE